MINLTQIPKPIIDLASQTASKPIASFSEFISLKLFGKTNARLIAEAENEYNKTIQSGEIQRKAQEPFIVQIETAKAFRQYSNLGNTLMKAIPMIMAPENKVTNDNDVFWGFLEHSKEISNEEVQKLIAKIIAGEYNTPGTYSMSTLQVIKMLGKSDLKLFEKICCLLIIGDQIPEELFSLPDSAKDIMNELQIDFGSLQTLQSLSLFLPNSMTRSIQNPERKNFKLEYFDKGIFFTPESENFIKIEFPSFFGLSMVGKQILKHLNSQYSEKYFVWLRENYKIPNYRVLEKV